MVKVGVALDRILRIKPHLRFERISDTVALVLGERERYVVSRGAAATLLAEVDGRRSVAEIITACAGRVSTAQAQHSLAQLQEQGVLVEGESHGATATFWYELGLAPPGTAFRVGVGVAARESFEAVRAAFCEELAQAELVYDADASFRVLLTDDYASDATARAAWAARAAGAHCFLVKPGGTVPWIGPVLAPSGGPCWQCLRDAVQSQRPVEAWLERAHQRPPAVSCAASPASLRIALALAAVEVTRLLAASDFERHELLALDLATRTGQSHVVRRRPQCPTCGDPELMTKQGEAALELSRVECEFREDGGYRRQSPEQSYARLRHLVSPVLGPIAYLEPCPERGAGRFPVFRSGFMVSPRVAVPAPTAFDRVCAGKGRTVAQARASALAEALERYAGVYQGDEPRRRASLRSLGDAAISPESLQHFSDNQLASRNVQNAQLEQAGRRVPMPLAADTEIDWTPAWSLSAQRRRYVPLAYCYTESPEASGSEYFVPNSNGCAAGACLEEAVLQGLLELIERDAIAIWWYNSLQRPRFSHGSEPLRDTEWLTERDRARGWSGWLLDLTHDLDVPVVVAVAENRGTASLALGFGCHVEPELAAQRAIAELHQVFEPRALRDAPWNHPECIGQTWLQPSPGESRLARAEERAARASVELKFEIERLVARLAARGLEVLVVDKSRPDVELNVVQVLVPGLRHFWPRFAPGRLYEVPVRLGWRECALRESELNPLPLLL